TLDIRMLLLAWRRAAEHGTDLRLLLPNPAVLRVMGVLGVDAVLPVYSTLEEALAGAGERSRNLGVGLTRDVALPHVNRGSPDPPREAQETKGHECLAPASLAATGPETAASSLVMRPGHDRAILSVIHSTRCAGAPEAQSRTDARKGQDLARRGPLPYARVM